MAPLLNDGRDELTFHHVGWKADRASRAFCSGREKGWAVSRNTAA